MSSNQQSQTIAIGEWFFKYRDYTPIPLIIMLLIWSEATVVSATLGVLSICFGELFRIYSVSFIGTVSRTRSDSTGQRLVSSGPFAIVRNPLYVGNFFVSVGFSLFSGVAWIVAVTAALFFVQYYFIVKYEESILSKKFGDEYQGYLRKVPAFVPSKLPKLDNIDWPKEYSHALKSEKRTLTTIFVLLGLLMVLS
ncbi:MAG: isoprenylcysteine carboxylmethyltransferase family protein [Pseudobacteriovorax sp.]|nr:isoprenylcysteine carboxylmethyltransferase family protein [Pseudobacteriovorax sp.]